MKNQIEIVKDVADGMIGIGGVPSNEEFYVEFDMRIKAALNIPVVRLSLPLECPKCKIDLRYNDGHNSNPEYCDDPNYGCKCGFKIYLAPSRQ